MRKLILLPLIPALLAGCSGRNQRSDAYGNFESREYLISAEGQGKILFFDVREGDVLDRGQEVGCIDTMSLYLQKEQLESKIRATEARRPGIRAQIEVLSSQKNTLLVEKERLERLLEDGAATGKQMDDLEGQLATIEKQMEATRSGFVTIDAEVRALQAQVRIKEDQLKRNVIVNPVGGTVLEKYTEPYEMAMPGKPLYKIADLSTMVLRAYISGEQLPAVKTGQQVWVIIDDPATLKDPLPGKVTWISGESEFTPKIIQTREERVHLVYAIEIEVPNDGRLKIGMPGEVNFH